MKGLVVTESEMVRRSLTVTLKGKSQVPGKLQKWNILCQCVLFQQISWRRDCLLLEVCSSLRLDFSGHFCYSGLILE